MSPLFPFCLPAFGSSSEVRPYEKISVIDAATFDAVIMCVYLFKSKQRRRLFVHPAAYKNANMTDGRYIKSTQQLRDCQVCRNMLQSVEGDIAQMPKAQPGSTNSALEIIHTFAWNRTILVLLFHYMYYPSLYERVHISILKATMMLVKKAEKRKYCFKMCFSLPDLYSQ